MNAFRTYEMPGIDQPAVRCRSLYVFLAILFSQYLLFTHAANAQCSDAPSMVFANPVLIGGTDGQIGATYRFPNAAPGIDVHIRILNLVHGALLGEIDNTTQGYYDAWQPYVTAGANDTSWLDWHISFKKAGTNVDTVLPCLAVTAIDIDGDNSTLKEFVRASTPGAYAVDPFTTLSITFDGVNNQAVGQVTTIPLIDTSHREAMFQMNFSNVSSIIYRNGSISTKATVDVRHTCIYFKPFWETTLVILPVKLQAFTATEINQSTRLTWMVQEENSMHSYIVQRSVDGIQWEDVNTVFAVNSPGYNSYYLYDRQKPAGITYYRLQLTDKRGISSYSHTVLAGNNIGSVVSVKSAALVARTLSLQVTSPIADAYGVRVYTPQGQLLMQKQFSIAAGAGRISTDIPQAVSDGMYIVTIVNRQGQLIYTGKILRQH